MRPRRPVALAAALTTLTALAVVLAGCVALPTDGPVVESEPTAQEDARRASDIDARPPVAGASRSEVVTGFLDAMTAWPIQTSVAKQYLTDEAAAGWNPEQETVIYSDSLPASETGGSVAVELTSADRLDEGGGWRGAMSGDDLTLRYRVTVEDGEFRIADPDDALVVPASWFRQRYRQVSLYYFDPLAQILVPEPVFVPRGAQLATSLVSGLLAGPPPLARGVVRSFLPQGLSVGLSVPVDDDGVAAISLVGEAPDVTAEESRLILAQLAWTLRQDPAVDALRVTVDGEALPLPGGASQYPVDAAEDLGPAGPNAATPLYGLSRGRLVWGSSGNLTPASGPFGDENAGLAAVAVRPDGLRGAALDLDGRRVRVASVADDPDQPQPRTVLDGGVYARPTWDVAGRLWVLERRGRRAVVWLVDGQQARQIDVPTITGTDAHALIVSRDGTRLIGVVRTGAGDEVRGARLVIGGRGRVTGARAPFVVRAAEEGRITDLAWTSPIQVGLLSPTAPGNLYEVDVVAADGASVGVRVLSSIVTGRVLGLAGSPTQGAAMLAVLPDGYLDLVRQQESDTGGVPLTQLDYAG